MTQTLNSITERIFECRVNASDDGLVYMHKDQLHRKDGAQMEIPVGKPVFEIPLFLFNKAFSSLSNNPKVSTLVAELYTKGRKPSHKTVSRFMCDVLITHYPSMRFIDLEVKQGEDTIKYYGTYGAVFDTNFEPLMMCSWEMERLQVDGNTVFSYLRPIIRIHPDCFLNQHNSMEKFLAKKFINTALTTLVNDVPIKNELFTITERTRAYPVVEIGASPFAITKVIPPPVTISNQDLLQVARDHIEEII